MYIDFVNYVACHIKAASHERPSVFLTGGINANGA
jgi:hypothetical protein